MSKINIVSYFYATETHNIILRNQYGSVFKRTSYLSDEHPVTKSCNASKITLCLDKTPKT